MGRWATTCVLPHNACKIPSCTCLCTCPCTFFFCLCFCSQLHPGLGESLPMQPFSCTHTNTHCTSASVPSKSVQPKEISTRNEIMHQGLKNNIQIPPPPPLPTTENPFMQRNDVCWQQQSKSVKRNVMSSVGSCILSFFLHFFISTHPAGIKPSEKLK